MVRFRLSERARKLLREIGTIVLGVLIALFIGEIADAIRWKFRVDASMAAIRQELSGNRWNAAERLGYQPCVEARLAAIGRILQNARNSHTLPDLRNVSSVGLRLTDQYAYEIARSEGAPLHMNSEQARVLAKAYGTFVVYVLQTEAERESWNTLDVMEGLPGPITDELLDTLLQAWAAAKLQANNVRVLSVTIDQNLADEHIPIDFDPDAMTRSALVHKARNRPLCRPMLVDGHSIR